MFDRNLQIGRERGEGAKCARKWYAVWVRSACEQLVADGLLAREIEHYLPTRMVSQHGRIVEATMFPGYLFARVSGPSMVPVLEVPGVVQVLGRGATPEPVPETEIEAIRQFSLLRPAAQILPHLCAGQRVRIRTFDFEGFEGVVAKVDGREMVAVNIEIIGRSLAVDIAAEDLEIIGESQSRAVEHTPITFARQMAPAY